MLINRSKYLNKNKYLNKRFTLSAFIISYIALSSIHSTKRPNMKHPLINKNSTFIDSEVMSMVVMMTNLHHKMCLLIQQFSLIFSRVLPASHSKYIPLLLRVLLLFFQKNQILSPDVFKDKNYSSLLRHKRSFEQANRRSNEEMERNPTSESTEGEQSRGSEATTNKMRLLNALNPKNNKCPKSQILSLYTILLNYPQSQSLINPIKIYTH